ncbi:MAG: hypothetical protein QXJ25_02340 [Candidatus Aenigmatarchaeota archaeon]
MRKIDKDIIIRKCERCENKYFRLIKKKNKAFCLLCGNEIEVSL